MAFAFQKFELSFIHKDGIVVKTRYQESKDHVGFVVVYNEETDIPFEGHVWERSSKIIVQYSCSLISKCAETEIFSNGAIFVFDNDILTVPDWSYIDPLFQ